VGIKTFAQEGLFFIAKTELFLYNKVVKLREVYGEKMIGFIHGKADLYLKRKVWLQDVIYSYVQEVQTGPFW